MAEPIRVDFSNLYRDWVFPAFRPLWDDRNRIIISYGGAGSGKSFDEAMRLLYRTIAEPGHNFLVVREVADTNRYSTYALLRQIIQKWGIGKLFRIVDTNMRMFCANGNSIAFAGLNDVERLKSITFPSGPLTDIWIEEASEINEDDYDLLNLRLRGEAKVPFQTTMTFNPIRASHWLKRRFFDRPQANTTVLRTTYRDNPRLNPAYVQELETLREIDRVKWDVYANGEWGNLGNQIFTNFVLEPCRYSPAEFDAIYYGMDFGFNHYHAIEGLGVKDGELYSFAELYVRQRTNSEIIDDNERKGVLPKGSRCVCDSAEPKSIEDWRRAGYTTAPAKKGPDSVRAQIGWLKDRKWHIDPIACPGLAAEVQGYAWRVDKDGNVLDEPVPYQDDAVAACRYAIEDLVKQGRFTLL